MSMDLKPCPFCGRVLDAQDCDTLHPSGTVWRAITNLGTRVYGNQKDLPNFEGQCWIVSCPCGAELHGDSREETISAWNRRSIVANKRIGS